MPDHVAGPETICPVCGREYLRLSQHWSASACARPPLNPEQHETTRGLLLAGATLADPDNGAPFVTIGTTNNRLALWTYNQLGWLGHGVRTVERDPVDHDPIYRVRTHAHPALARYQWARGEVGLPEPDEIVLTPRVGRAWWAYSGGLQWPGEYDSQRTGTISAEADERADRVLALLASVGIDAVRVGRRVQLSPLAIDEWLDWIGGPVDGVAYKWVEMRAVYERERERYRR